jgi:hypothetical protein
VALLTNGLNGGLGKLLRGDVVDLFADWTVNFHQMLTPLWTRAVYGKPGSTALWNGAEGLLTISDYFDLVPDFICKIIR